MTLWPRGASPAITARVVADAAANPRISSTWSSCKPNWSRRPGDELPGVALAGQRAGTVVGPRRRLRVPRLPPLPEANPPSPGPPPPAAPSTANATEVTPLRDSDGSQNQIEGPGDAREIEGFDQQAGVANLASSAAAHEPPELGLVAPALLCALLLQGAERPQLALGVDDSFHRLGTEGADELVLQVGHADVEAQPLQVGATEVRAEAGTLERSAEVILLALVAADPPPSRRDHEDRAARGSSRCSWPRP